MIPTLLGVAILVFAMLRAHGRRSGRSDDARRRRATSRRPSSSRNACASGSTGPSTFSSGNGSAEWRPAISACRCGPASRSSQEIASRLQLSLQVAVMATVLAVLISIPLGTLSALYKDTWIDQVIRVISIARARGAVVLARHDHHPRAALVLPLASADHLHAVLREPAREPGAAHLAGARGRLPLLGRGDAHDALDAARGAAGGLHPHGARQGRVRAPGRRAARAVERDAAGGDGDRPRVRVPDRRARGDRAGVQPERHRQALRAGGGAQRLHHDPGAGAAGRRVLHTSINFAIDLMYAWLDPRIRYR